MHQVFVFFGKGTKFSILFKCFIGLGYYNVHFVTPQCQVAYSFDMAALAFVYLF
jgi:hypothetical protein